MKKLRRWKVGENLSISNLKIAIDKSRNINLEKFIYSVGIRHIGQENAKILAAFFISIKEFSNFLIEKQRKLVLKNLVELDGIGSTQIESIENFFLMKKIEKLQES